MDICCRLMSLLFNMLSRFVIVFLPRSKHLLISRLQSPSTYGKGQFLVSRAPSWLQIWPFGGISWPFHHMVLGMFIPRLAKISLVGHSMYYTRPFLVVSKVSGPPVLVASYGLGKYSLLLLLPISRVLLLQSLILYGTIYSHFIINSVTHLLMQETIIL